jgi:ketosteroid isomerase-like protein
VPASNVELARRAFDAMQAGGLPAVLEFLDPEVEFEPPDNALERRGSFKGHAAVRERWDVLFEPFAEVRIEPEEFVDAGEETIVAVFRINARGKASGVPVEMQLGYVLSIRDGKVVRMKAYLDPEEAKHAAGLAGD